MPNQCDAPVVTVIIVTYNHEAFIEQAVRGVLDQQTEFGVELIVTEDCSTDGTVAVIERMSETLGTPINLLRSKTNLNTMEVVHRALAVGRGEFFAIMDGDDYWTDGSKLQKQVDVMRADPGIAMTFHDVAELNDATGEVARTTSLGACELSMCQLITTFVPSCSALFRRSVVTQLPAWVDETFYLDRSLWLVAAQQGRIEGLGGVMGVYRIHAGGAWTAASQEEQCRGFLDFLDLIKATVGTPCRAEWNRARRAWLTRLGRVLLDKGDRVGALSAGLKSAGLAPRPSEWRSTAALLVRSMTPHRRRLEYSS